ncbi:MAG: O-antigen ligase family protein, partial [Chloroflexota bacterium]|nr:O-antigen ligase family protein [Chloroflexota bacterium]
MDSTTGNALSLSSFLAMTMPLTMALLAMAWSKRRKERNARRLAALGVLLALQFYCLWLAQYSVTILLFIIPPVLFITLLGISSRKKWILGVGAACLVGLAVVAALFLTSLATPAAENPIQTTSSDVQVNEENLRLESHIYGRARQWWSSVDIVRKASEVPLPHDPFPPSLRPLIGYGPETYTASLQRFFAPEYRSVCTSVSTLRDRPHNHYLYLAATMGILGLLAFLTVLGTFFYGSFRSLRRAGPQTYKLLLIALMAGMGGYMADMLFNPSTLSAELVFWLMLAISGLWANDSINSTNPINSTNSRALRASRRKYLPLACVVMAIIVALGLTIRPLLADVELQKALNLQAQDSASTVFAFDRTTKIYPREPVYWGYLGGYSYDVALQASEGARHTILELSTSALEQARELEPYTAYRYYTLADVYLYWAYIGAADKWEKTLSLYAQAGELFPDNAVITNKEALALLIKGDFGQAQAKLDRAMAIDPGWAETCFLSGLLLAREGRAAEAAPELIAPLAERPENLGRFSEFCRKLI